MESDEYDFPSKYRLASIIILIGGLAALVLFILTFIAPPEVVGLDKAMNPSEFRSGVISNQEWALVLAVLDTIRIGGYLAMYAGLWFVIRDLGEVFAGLSFLLGALVAMFDILENAILMALFRGIPAGWDPDPSIFNFLWTLNELINITSYLVALMFGVQFLLIFTRDPLKQGIGYLFLVYMVIGLLAVVFPIFSVAQTVVLIIGLFTVSYMLWDEHDISDDDLLDLLRRENESTDYIQ